jgi:hypothetical protein
MYRIGMWVTDGHSVGICFTDAKTLGQYVHIVGENGDTIKIVAWSSDWKQAKHAQIPEARRPTVEVAQKYGYAV